MNTDLQTLNNLAHELLVAQAGVEEKEEELKKAKERLRLLTEETIPEAMEDLGVEPGTRIVTPVGELVLGETIRASITQEKREAALHWLKSNGEADLIKNAITVEFGRGEDDQATALAADLAGLGKPITQKQQVHPQTLSAWVRSRLADGLDIPEAITYFQHRTVKLRT